MDIKVLHSNQHCMEKEFVFVFGSFKNYENFRVSANRA